MQLNMEIPVADDKTQKEVGIHLVRPTSAEPDQTLFALPCVGCTSVLWFEVNGLHEAMKSHGFRALAGAHDAEFELVGMSDENDENQIVVLLCDECTEREIAGSNEEPEEWQDVTWTQDIGLA